MNVLAVGCHPDDIEISCCGTLAKCVKRGDKVTVCHVANGNMGHEIISPEELREIRIGEAKKAGSLAGIEVVTLDIGDLLPNGCDIAQRDKLVELIKKVQPDFIITHSPTDYMPDHLAVSKLVFDASFAASVPHYGAEGKAAVVPIFYMDNLAGMNFNPTEYVDISDEIDLKIQMLECHESQLKWMRDHDGIDFAEFVRTCSRFRGIQCGAQYAEAFCQELVWPKVVARRLLP
ncbi:MAG: PIG-L family deacetylase [Clostridia bacterium]|nr:PIG-L family deacetylase [Clostridia bacterium]MBQ8637494.1 PIG-L family deacetylase [Clostridia bacterium]